MNSEEKKNYLYNIIYRLSICLLLLMVTPYVARVLGAEQVGIFTFSNTIACYFIMFGRLGLDIYGNRCIASCREDIEKRSRMFWGIYMMQIATSLLSILIFILLVWTVFREHQSIYWIQLLYVGAMLFDVGWFFHGMEKFRIITIRSLLSRMIMIVGIFLFVHTEKDLWIYTCIMSACFLFEQLQLLPFLYRYIKWVPLKKEDILIHIRPNIKLFIPLVAFSVFHWMDKIMLGLIVQSTAVVAFYTYAENIINLPKGILSALDTVMLPRISNLVANHRIEEGVQKMRNSIRLNNIVCCALGFGIAGVAPSFVPWFLGAEFAPTTFLTMGLAMVLIPVGIANVIQSQYLLPFHLEHIYTKAVFFGAATNIILNLSLIPFFGASGAVIGTFVAEIVVCMYQLVHIRDVYSVRQLLRSLLPFVACGVLEFVVTYSLGALPINTFLLLILQICVGGTVYITGCIIYFILIAKEYHSVRDLCGSLKL